MRSQNIRGTKKKHVTCIFSYNISSRCILIIKNSADKSRNFEISFESSLLILSRSKTIFIYCLYLFLNLNETQKINSDVTSLMK